MLAISGKQVEKNMIVRALFSYTTKSVSDMFVRYMENILSVRKLTKEIIAHIYFNGYPTKIFLCDTFILYVQILCALQNDETFNIFLK